MLTLIRFRRTGIGLRHERSYLATLSYVRLLDR